MEIRLQKTLKVVTKANIKAEGKQTLNSLWQLVKAIIYD